jgi:hypothetical protein
MLRPIGTLPPAVYWRRRLVVVGALVVLVVLLVLTVKSLGSSGGSPAAAADTRSSSTAPTTHAKTAAPVHRSAARTSASTTSTAPARSRTTSSAAAAQPCTAAELAVAAVVEHSSYHVGDQPVVMLQATDTGSAPCVQDFGNGKVELRIYNGESRVWGSNDCAPAAGALERTLTPNQAVRVRITWSGLSSQPGCKGTRARVGAGTYTLYAALSGKSGSAAQFGIS